MTFLPGLGFGELLKQLRKRAGMTQGDLATALGYSIALISAIERSQRLPDLDAVIQHYIPALALEAEPHLTVQLVEAAAHARGERPPAYWKIQRERRLVISEEVLVETQRLPLPPTQLIGRQQDLEQIGRRLLGHHGRLLTLVGAPGIGKTRLALAAAVQLQLHFRDGATFVPLAAAGDGAALASAILTALGNGTAGPKPPHVQLIEVLRRQSLLLVLDNFEQLLAPALGESAAGLVAELLAACPGVVVLVTSRERLHLRAEQRYRVPPLALDDALALFAARAAGLNSAFTVTGANRLTLETICRRLDCLPLAIELCAAQSDLIAPAQLLAQLQARSLDLLVDGARDLPARQRTLRTAIEHSYHLLAEEQRTLWRALGVFVGGFDLEAAARVANASATALRALAGKSLIQVDATASGEQRFLLLETLREFALEQVCAYGEEAEIRQRHYQAYLHLFRTGDSQLRGPESAAWLSRLQAEQDNLRAALQWALGQARYEDLAWLLVAAGFFSAISGRRHEEAGWLTKLLPHRTSLPVDLRLAVMGSFFAAAAGLPEFSARDAYLAETVELMAFCPYKQLHASAWVFMASCYVNVGQTAAALALSVQLLRDGDELLALGPEFGTQADCDFLLAANLWGYAMFLLGQGQVAQAARLLAESHELFRRRGNRAFAADCVGTLGLLALLRGELGEANACLQEAVAVATMHKLPLTLCSCQPLLAIVHLYRGDEAEANRLLQDSLQLCLQVRNTDYLARVCAYLAEAALWQGKCEEASQWLAQSLAYEAPAKHMAINELQRLFVALRLAAAQGDYRWAAALGGIAKVAHAQIHNIDAGPMLPLAAAALAAALAALGSVVFNAAFAAGQQLSHVEAYAGLDYNSAPSRCAATRARMGRYGSG
ncbi:MAG: helix-turn-helix domain-containing protein [Caldilineaceae bacterium]